MRVKHIRAETIFIWSFDLFINNFDMFSTVLFFIKNLFDSMRYAMTFWQEVLKHFLHHSS